MDQSCAVICDASPCTVCGGSGRRVALRTTESFQGGVKDSDRGRLKVRLYQVSAALQIRNCLMKQERYFDKTDKFDSPETNFRLDC
jgi:hypothetical protein